MKDYKDIPEISEICRKTEEDIEVLQKLDEKLTTDDNVALLKAKSNIRKARYQLDKIRCLK